MKKVYLANPYGFSEQQKGLLEELQRKLEILGLEVWEPFARNDQVDFADSSWAYKVSQADKKDVEECDAIFAVVNGNPPDEGVMIELGMAIALGKPTFLFRDDFRKCSDSEEYPLNLMVFAGLPQENWRDYYFSSVDEITQTNKALYKWAKDID